MAKKKYRVLYGTHWFPNPEHNPVLAPDGSLISDVPSHLEAKQGDVIELEEARAVQFTKNWPSFPAKLREVSDSAGIPEVNTEPEPAEQPLRSVDAPPPPNVPPALPAGPKDGTMRPIQSTPPMPPPAGPPPSTMTPRK